MSIYDSQSTEPSEIPIVPDTFEKDTSIGQVGNFKKLTVGAGNTKFELNKEGMFLGGADYTTAQYSQDFDGKIQIRDSSGNVVVQIDPNG